MLYILNRYLPFVDTINGLWRESSSLLYLPPTYPVVRR